MTLPFTVEQFLGVFERYNLAIWPLHVLGYILGLVAVWLALWPGRRSDRAIAAILAAFWLWIGAVYHVTFFRAINPAATAFGALFILQGLVWLLAGVVRPRLMFRAGAGGLAVVGGLLILYATVVYPILGTLLGHGYPRSPSFGVAPCPTTIFTFGLLLWTRPLVPKYVLVAPLAWTAIASTAAFSLGMVEDLGLLVAALLATGLLLWRDRRAARSGGLRPSYA